MQDSTRVQPYAATLISLAALGVDSARIIVQLPENALVAQNEVHLDSLNSAARLHRGRVNHSRMMQVDALQALGEAAAQCAVCPGTLSPCGRAVRCLSKCAVCIGSLHTSLLGERRLRCACCVERVSALQLLAEAAAQREICPGLISLCRGAARCTIKCAAPPASRVMFD